MFGFDDMLIGGRCCIGLISLIMLILLFIMANGLDSESILYFN